MKIATRVSLFIIWLSIAVGAAGFFNMLFSINDAIIRFFTWVYFFGFWGIWIAIIVKIIRNEDVDNFE